MRAIVLKIALTSLQLPLAPCPLLPLPLPPGGTSANVFNYQVIRIRPNRSIIFTCCCCYCCQCCLCSFGYAVLKYCIIFCLYSIIENC